MHTMTEIAEENSLLEQDSKEFAWSNKPFALPMFWMEALRM
jgi:hypothetical protein